MALDPRWILAGLGLLLLVGLLQELTEGRKRRQRLTQRLEGVKPTQARGPSRVTLRPTAPTAGPLAPLARLLDTAFGVKRSLAADEAASLFLPVVIGLVVGGGALAVGRFMALDWVTASLLGAGVALLTARMRVAGRREAVTQVLADQFPDALGVITRCVRAGIPVMDAVRVVGEEMPSPTGPGFRRCADQVLMGEDVEEALRTLAARSGLAEYRFFATSVSLQRQTGGNLSETLDNLADMIRKRRGVRLRAKAMSSEARATVAVLSVLPFAVALLMFFVNAEYILQLFTTKDGNNVLLAAAAFQGTGLFVVREMIRRSLRG